jgi:hypothetical protein
MDYAAAIKAFRDMALSAAPDREWTMGVTALRLALEKFQATAQPSAGRRLLDRFLTVYTLGLRIPGWEKAGESCVVIALTIAAAYRVERNRALVEQYCRIARQQFESYQRLYIEERYAEAIGSGRAGPAEERKKRAEEEMSALSLDLDNVCRRLASFD